MGYAPRNAQDQERAFWTRTDRSGDCWLWTGARHPRGHGIVARGGRHHRAYRVAWEYINGPIPEGMRILHRCDVPRCVNPAHLFLGTQIDNIRDMVAKNRQSKGTDRPGARLSEDDVREIRRLAATRELTRRAIGLRFDIPKSYVHAIVSRRKWKCVA